MAMRTARPAPCDGGAPAATLALALALVAACGVAGCDRGPRAGAADAAPPAPRRVPRTEPMSVGPMSYRVVSARATRRIPRRGGALEAPPGSAFVIVEYQRTWNGASAITAPATPLDLVTAGQRRVAADLDALAAHVLATNCGELGPSRLDPGRAERNCVAFVVPEGSLGDVRLEPSALAHQGRARPIMDLGALAIE